MKRKRKHFQYHAQCSVAIIRSILTGSYLLVGFPLQNSRSWTTWLSTDLKNLGIKTPFAWLFSNEVQLKCIFKSETTGRGNKRAEETCLNNFISNWSCFVRGLLCCFYFAAVAEALVLVLYLFLFLNSWLSRKAVFL